MRRDIDHPTKVSWIELLVEWVKLELWGTVEDLAYISEP